MPPRAFQRAPAGMAGQQTANGKVRNFAGQSRAGRNKTANTYARALPEAVVVAAASQLGRRVFDARHREDNDAMRMMKIIARILQRTPPAPLDRFTVEHLKIPPRAAAVGGWAGSGTSQRIVENHPATARAERSLRRSNWASDPHSRRRDRASDRCGVKPLIILRV